MGFWVIALSFLELAPETFAWTLAISGLVIAALGFWGAVEHDTMASGKMV